MTNLEADIGIVNRVFHQDKLAAVHIVVRRGGPLREWDNATWVERQMLWMLWSRHTSGLMCLRYTEENMKAFSAYLHEDVIDLTI